ncbi:MAG: AAA family ATPase [Myxococcota bacterium]
MTVRVQSLRVARFRGFEDEVVVQLEGRALVLLGDNGSGKSSLIEALEYGLTGDIRALSGRGQRVSLKKHAGHVGAKAPPEITVVLASGAATAEVSPATDPAALDEPFRSYVLEARRQRFLLRRSQVLELIEAQDRNRYDALSPFLGVAAFEPVERACKRASEQTQGRLQEAERVLREAAATVANRVGSVAEATVRRWLESRVAVVGRSVPDSLIRLDDALAGLHGGSVGAEAGMAALRLRLQDLDGMVPPDAAFAELHESLDEAARWDASEGIRYERVLEEGVRWLLELEEPTCPLCRSAIEVRHVVEQAQARLADAAAAVAARERATRALDSLRRAVARVREGVAATERPWVEVVGTPALDPVRRWADEARAVLGAERRELDRRALERLRSEAVELRRHVRHLAGHVPEARADPRERAVADLLWAREAVPAWCRAQRAAERAEAAAERGKRLHTLAQEARRGAAREVLEATADDVTDIYRAFHAEEAPLAVRVEVKASASSSAKLLVDYLDRRGEDPRGLLSEGHLDTLGLALFFGMHRRQRGGFGLLLLDDVLGTIDATHRERILRWLMRELSDQQLVVTTHSRQWWEWMRNVARTEGAGGRFRFREVTSTADGVSGLVDMETRVERLKRGLAEAAPPDDIGRLAGALLEAELQAFRVRWGLAVPARRDERYTIGDIWPVMNRKLRKVRPSFRERVGGVREVIDGMGIIRNWTAHANAWEDLTRAEARAFAEAVLGFCEAMACPTCGRWLEVDGEAVMCGKRCPEGVLCELSGRGAGPVSTAAGVTAGAGEARQAAT